MMQQYKYIGIHRSESDNDFLLTTDFKCFKAELINLRLFLLMKIKENSSATTKMIQKTIKCL